MSEGLTNAFLALIFYSGAALIARDLYDLEEILTVFTLLLFSLANTNAIVGLGISRTLVIPHIHAAKPGNSTSN